MCYPDPGRRHRDRGGCSIEPPVRVIVADDHAATRKGIRLALEQRGFEVSGEASDAPGAVELAIRLRPDMCLLDVHMPGGGIWAVAQIVRELPDTPIVMVTVSDDNAELFAALQAGAWGYLLKDIGPEALADELHAVLRGEAVLPATLTASLIEEFRARGRRTWWQIVRAGGVRLTSREFEIAECLREGLSTQEIARKLDVSPVTVRRHVGAVLRKLGVADRAGAQELLQGRSET